MSSVRIWEVFGKLVLVFLESFDKSVFYILS